MKILLFFVGLSQFLISSSYLLNRNHRSTSLTSKRTFLAASVPPMQDSGRCRLRLYASDRLNNVDVANSLEAFDLATNNPLTDDSLQAWQSSTDKLVGEFKSMQESAMLLYMYEALLAKSAVVELDPLQMATFDILTGAIVDALVRLNGAVAVTQLIDRVTDVHLDYIDKFAELIDDGGSDGYSQSSKQEFLGYQFGGLARRCYGKISRTWVY